MATAPEVEAFAKHLATITDATERERMIRRAKLLAADDAPQEAFEPPIRTLADYLAADIKIPPILVEPALVVRGGLNATIGRAGKGKTVFGQNRLMKWACGRPVFDTHKDLDGNPMMNPSGPLKCLLVENEGAAGMFHRNIGRMLNAEGILSDEDRKLVEQNLLIWGEGGYSHLKLDDEAKLKELRAGIEKWQPDIVFIEPFRSLWKGEENSATEMNIVVDALVGIATDYDCGVIISHHEKKGGAGEDDKMSAARGSSVLEGIVTIMENFEAVKGGDFREVTWSKSRYETAPIPIRMEWDNERWWYQHVPVTRLDEEIMQAFRNNDTEALSASQLMELLDEKRDKLNKRLKLLVDEGLLIRTASSASRDGTTGFRYRLKTDDMETNGGLDL